MHYTLFRASSYQIWWPYRAFLSNITCGWPQADLCITLTPAMHYALVKGSSYQIWWPYRVFLSNLTSVWPKLTFRITFDPINVPTLWSRILPTKFCCHRAFMSNLTPGWPLHDLWPQQCITLQSRILPTKFSYHRAFLSNLTLVDPCMTFDPINALHFGQGFLLANLVAIGHSWAIWPLLDSSWPLHDLWPQECITLQSGILPTKFTIWLLDGHFQKLTTNLGGPFPTTLSSIGSMRRSTTKRIAGHTNNFVYRA